MPKKSVTPVVAPLRTGDVDRFACVVARQSHYRLTRIFLFPEAMPDDQIRQHITRRMGPGYRTERGSVVYAALQTMQMPTVVTEFPCINARRQRYAEVTTLLFRPTFLGQTTQTEERNAKATYLGADIRTEGAMLATFIP